MSRKVNKIIGLLIFILGIIYLIVDSVYASKESRKTALASEIIGVVKNINYDVKSIPTITVNNQEFYLNEYALKRERKIAVGDSIYKLQGERELKHYKKYSNGFYLYESYEID